MGFASNNTLKKLNGPVFQTSQPPITRRKGTVTNRLAFAVVFTRRSFIVPEPADRSSISGASDAAAASLAWPAAINK